MFKQTISLLLVVGPAVANADDNLDVDVDADVDVDVPDRYSYAWRDDRLYSKIGVGVSLGGGVSGFTDEGMRDALSSDAGGLWDLRVAFGTHIPLGLELGYIGTASDVASIRTTDNATMVGTTIEGALRWNILPHNSVNPYVFGGIGWQRYDITGAELSRADAGIADSADLMVVPVGAGLGYRDMSGLVLDLRGTVRIAQDETFVTEASGASADLHTWEASGNIGYEF